MKNIVFQTAGEIDIRSFTTMGLSSKPNTKSPIGYFGTGLKYAVAVTLRLGGSFIVWIGKDRYEFFLKPTKFRGKDFELVRMKRKKFSLTRATNHDLPFTTSYGRNWEWWQVYRELESNTRDENGFTFETEDAVIGEDGCTKIIISAEGFNEAYKGRNEIFLPDEEEGFAIEDWDNMQIRYKDGNFFYWRGLRVYKLRKPSLFTYNFKGYMSLTEDRTLYGDFQAREAVATWLLTVCDKKSQIAETLTAPEDVWEYELSFEEGTPCSAIFEEVARKCRPTIPMFRPYWNSREKAKKRIATKNPWSRCPLPWKVQEDGVTDANGEPIFLMPNDFEGDWLPIAEAICKRIERSKK